MKPFLHLLCTIVLVVASYNNAYSQKIQPLTEAQVTYEYELTKTAFCSDGSDRANSSGPRFAGPMEARGFSYKNFQYVAYYEHDGSIVIARRNLDRPDRWKKSVIQGHKMVLHDRHRKIALALSKGDGVIHIAFDHHNTPGFNYAQTAVGVADNPEDVEWNDEIFKLLPDLGLTNSAGSVTYPNFYELEGTNDLIVYWRTGGAVGGEMNLAHYSCSEHAWSFIGRISSEDGTYLGKTDTRGPYGTGFHSDKNGRLHTAWLWREDAFDEQYHYGNHGTYYAYSDDGGFSWNDTNGKPIADSRKGETISIDNIGEPPVDIPLGFEASNAQHFAAIDLWTGDFHYFSNHQLSLTNKSKKVHHYVRKASGEWSAKITNINGGGGSVFFTEDYAFATQGDDIFYSARSDDFQSWTKLSINKSLPGGAAVWDASRINEGVLSYLVQFNPTSLGKPSPVRVVEVRIAEDLTPKPQIQFVNPQTDTTLQTGYSDFVVKVNATFESNIVDSVTLYVDDTVKVLTDFEAPFEWGGNGELLELGAGLHTFKVVAKVNDTISATRYRDVLVEDDELKPAISNLSPTVDTTVTTIEKLIISAEASDVNGIDYAMLLLNDTEIGKKFDAPFTWGGKGNELPFIMGENKVKIVFVNTIGLSSDTTINITVVPNILSIPGKVQAEYYTTMSGVNTDVTTDTGTGLYVGWIGAGDWFSYQVDVKKEGIYKVNYRVAAKSSSINLELRINNTNVGSLTSSATGDWQTWKSVTGMATLNAGRQTIQVYAKGGGWNINWMNFTWDSKITSIESSREARFTVYPNPVNNKLSVLLPNSIRESASLRIFDYSGKLMCQTVVSRSSNNIDISYLRRGIYVAQLVMDNMVYEQKFNKN